MQCSLVLQEGGINENKIWNFKAGWRHKPADILLTFTVPDTRNSYLKTYDVQFDLAGL